ncbi:hypothetical protein LX32DRAFT_601410 [Colletotrichum zoysiae]|uniref:Uncharacterized protein n=1 Tax=Colletotrichum zoysiae TaxID=1216348 RepID=A0AAD9LVX6_9PEZI|nr:hypothetical protein LX32DRAFT_601410 [Colletotrichum zoysiae]
MDDQFGGRTDDDLFFDDFEPVSDPQVVQAVAAPPPPPPPAAVATPPVEPPKPEPVAPKPVQRPHPPQQPAAKRPPTAPRGGLANSRFADKPAAAAPRPPRKAAPATTPTTTAPAATGATPGANTALNAAARLGSGANPRTKLTETELAAKMEQMRILNAEKTRKFEQAEQDERSHAEAYARGMEEARQRRKLDEERRRRGEEERRRMDDERAKNRERKLKAMSMKEGGWDEGKDALAQEDEKRAGFRGANGGVRGAKSGAGLSGSRFARDNDDADGDRFAGAGPGEERRGGGRGRGRGRGGQGRGGAGRGGRGEHERGHAASNGADAQEAKPAATPAPVISTEEFPALPGKKSTTGGDEPLPMLSPLGRWDDEMEAFDAKLKSGADATE